jgi:hypothetical protein
LLALVASLAAGAGRRILLVSDLVTDDLAALVPPGARIELLQPARGLRERILADMAAEAGLVLDADEAAVLAGHLPGELHMLELAVRDLDGPGRGGRTGGRGAARAPAIPRRPVAPSPRPPKPATRTRLQDPAEEVAIEAGYRELLELVADVGRNIEVPTRLGRDVLVPLTARDGERYLLRMRPSRYLEEPLHCSFVDGEGRTEVSSAWPRSGLGNPFRSPNFICTSPTAEYHAVHREHPYRAGEGSFANTAATIFAALHAPEYIGRCRR